MQKEKNKTIYDELGSLNNKYIINKSEFDNNKKMKLSCNNKECIISPKYFGKYTKYYLKNINDNLFLFKK